MLAVAFDSPVSRLLASTSTVYWSRVLLFLPLPLAYLASGGLDARVERARASRAAWSIAFALIATVAVELLLSARDVHAVYPVAHFRATTPLLETLARDRSTFRVLPLHTFLPANSATLLGLDDLRGFDALAPAGWHATRSAIGKFRNVPTAVDTVAPWDLTPGGAALDSWNVKYLLLHPQFAFSAPTLNEKLGLDLEEIYSGPDGKILRNRRVLPRVRIEGASGAVDVKWRVPGCWRFTIDVAARVAPGVPPFAPAGVAPGVPPFAPAHEARVVVADAYWPGWRVRVDGAEIPLRLRKGELMTFPVAAGRHEVELSYEPFSFRAGLLLAVLAIAVFGVVFSRLPATPR
ncbi:MAG: YfhO family protein [Acidobacteria bacterium]|nr:YfhO family protein [Acidobacteriota bacterium]